MKDHMAEVQRSERDAALSGDDREPAWMLPGYSKGGSRNGGLRYSVCVAEIDRANVEMMERDGIGDLAERGWRYTMSRSLAKDGMVVVHWKREGWTGGWSVDGQEWGVMGEDGKVELVGAVREAVRVAEGRLSGEGGDNDE
jgi:hypothetical protein